MGGDDVFGVNGWLRLGLVDVVFGFGFSFVLFGCFGLVIDVFGFGLGLVVDLLGLNGFLFGYFG